MKKQAVIYYLSIMFVAIILLVGCFRGGERNLAPTPTPTSLQERDIGPTYEVPDSIDELMGYLSLHGSEVQILAVRKIAKMGTNASEAVPALTNILMVDNNLPEAREVAIQALGEIGPASKDAVPVIVTVLLTDRNDHVRRAAASALGAIKDKASIFALVQSLDDKDTGVSLIAAGVIDIFSEEDFSGGNTLDDTGVPIIVKEVKMWWKEKGQYMDWLVE